MRIAIVSIAAILCATATVSAQLYSENFEVDPTANWVVNGGPSDEAADFFFDYGSIGIPAAPSGAGTRGMKLQANLSGGIFSGMSASPIGKNFTGNYKVTFDWWESFNGPAPVGGSGSTNLGTFGIGTAGTSAQWPGGTQDSLWFGGTGDGNSSVDWRAYSPAAATGYTAPSGVFAAGTGTSPDARNNTHPYYAGFGSVTAPAAHVAAFPQQTGTTLVGSAGWEWHQVEINKLGDIVTWTVDGTLIATVDSSTFIFGGNNIFFGHSDINATSSTDPNDAALLFTLIDNIVVTPEPATLAMLLLGGLPLLRRRRSA